MRTIELNIITRGPTRKSLHPRWQPTISLALEILGQGVMRSAHFEDKKNHPISADFPLNLK